MADGIFNISKGRWVHYAAQVGTGNAALVVVLIQATGLQADDALADNDTLAAVLAATNDEATFTGYERKIVTASPITIDDVNNLVDVDFADQVWDPAGGAVNNDLGKLLVCYDADTAAGTDAAIIPISYHDFPEITTGSKLTAEIAAAGFARAQ